MADEPKSKSKDRKPMKKAPAPKAPAKVKVKYEGKNDPKNKTVVLKTAEGTVKLGEVMLMSKGLVNILRAEGYILTNA